mmetsp:Transcript_31958/g.96208  ORF Transcript_31958/g.96208 Transcript_31958/m.96208 type:complete len:253 (-) Transcript_31958:923-1681(-)
MLDVLELAGWVPRHRNRNRLRRGIVTDGGHLAVHPVNHHPGHLRGHVVHGEYSELLARCFAQPRSGIRRERRKPSRVCFEVLTPGPTPARVLGWPKGSGGSVLKVEKEGACRHNHGEAVRRFVALWPDKAHLAEWDVEKSFVDGVNVPPVTDVLGAPRILHRPARLPVNHGPAHNGDGVVGKAIAPGHILGGQAEAANAIEVLPKVVASGVYRDGHGPARGEPLHHAAHSGGAGDLVVFRKGQPRFIGRKAS